MQLLSLPVPGFDANGNPRPPGPVTIPFSVPVTGTVTVTGPSDVTVRDTTGSVVAGPGTTVAFYGVPGTYLIESGGATPGTITATVNVLPGTVLHPRDFGAAGDGADATAGLQAAINAASAVDGVVILDQAYMVNGTNLDPSGTYRYSLVCPGSVALIFDGGSLKLLDGSYVDDGKSLIIIDGEGPNTFRFHNLDLDGNSANQSFANATSNTFFSGISLDRNSGSTNGAEIIFSGISRCRNFAAEGHGIGIDTFGASTGKADILAFDNCDIGLWVTQAETSTPCAWDVNRVVVKNAYSSAVMFEGFGGANIGHVTNINDTLPSHAPDTLTFLTTNQIDNVIVGSTFTLNGAYPVNGGAGGTESISNTAIGHSVAVGCRGSYQLGQFDSSCQLGPFVAKGCAVGGIPGATVFGSFEIGGGAASDRVIGHDFTSIDSANGSLQFNGPATIRGGSLVGNTNPVGFVSDTVKGECLITGVFGYNPVGALPVPAIPASGTAVTNTFGVDATVYVAGGTVTAIDVAGTATGMTSGPVRVAAGQSITLTYSAAPTWTWFGD